MFEKSVLINTFDRLHRNKMSKYKSLDIKTKAAIIAEVKKGVKSKKLIASEYGIAASTLSTFLKHENKILSHVVDLPKKNLRKRMKPPKHPQVNQCLIKWFKQQRDKNVPLSGPLVKAKAEEFAASLGIEGFKASSGWLRTFQKENDIVFKNICGESGSVNLEDAEEWKKLLKDMIADREERDIFNVDEAGLFYQCVPNKTLSFKNEKCSGGKNSKQRVTLLFGANMDGSEKLPLLMIGRYANPRCFKNVQTKPIEYLANSKSWMTSNIFAEWLKKLNETYRKKKRTIILFIDNCSAHNEIPNMSNVKVIYLPPNMTSILQPMDQGVIKTFKHYYRQLVVENILAGSCLFIFHYLLFENQNKLIINNHMI